MRDFNSYNPSSQTGDAYKTLNDFAKKYEGASASELISAIMQEVEKGKKNGTLKSSDIDYFSSILSPLLNSQQKKQLDAIVKQIKGNL